MNKITADHLTRSAYVYVRQSTPDQLANNPENIIDRSTVNGMIPRWPQRSTASVHGGQNKAVYAYPAEHYVHWRREQRC